MFQIKIIVLLSICCSLSFIGAAQTAQHFYSEAKKAEEAKQYDQFCSLIMKAYELHPYNQNILWNAGIAAVLNNKTEQAIDFFSRAINISATYNLDDPN